MKHLLAAVLFVSGGAAWGQTVDEPEDEAQAVTSEEVASSLPSARRKKKQPRGELATRILRESDPGAWAPNGSSLSAYEVRWTGDPAAAVSAELVPGSLEWTRVDDVLVLPRAQLTISVAADGGHVSHGGFVHALHVFGGIGSVQLPVALLSGAEAVHLTFRKGGALHHGWLSIRRKPNSVASADRVHRDTSCSRYVVDVKAEGGDGGDWLQLGCRRVYVRGAGRRSQVVEATVYWDNVDGVEVNGAELANAPGQIIELRLLPEASRIELTSGARRVTIEYRLDEAHFGLLEASVGSNLYAFLGSPRDVLQVFSPFASLRLTYWLSDTMRVQSMAAINLNQRIDADVGLYLNYETARALDERLVVNLLVGAHAVAFEASDRYHIRVGAPQGIELVFRDALMRAFDAQLGGFVYPPIQGKAYVNVYVRYGRPGLYVELDYIHWTEVLEPDLKVATHSVGLSVGFPVLSFL